MNALKLIWPVREIELKLEVLNVIFSEVSERPKGNHSPSYKYSTNKKTAINLI